MNGVSGVTGTREAAEIAVEQWLRESGLFWEAGARRGEYVVELPGEAKLRTGVSVIVNDRALSVSAFVVRHPDENHERFYRWLLARNLRLPGIAFAVDRLGDVFLVARLPLPGVTPDSLDELMGALLTASDRSFNELLAIGFVTSIRREYAWRLDRGESTRNLDAFRSLLQDAEDPEPSASGATPD